MKIIHLLSQNHLTGAEVYAVTLARQQILKGHEVFQISNGFFCETPAQTIACPVETPSRLEFIRTLFQLRRLIKENKIDLIHTHSRAAAKLAYWSTFGLKVAVVSTIHGQQHSSLSKKIFNQYGDFKIAICENIQNHLIEDFGYNPHRIKLLRNTIDPKLYHWIEPQAPRGTEVSHQFRVAIVGRTTGPKKQRTQKILQALDQVQWPKNFKVTVDLVGGHLNNLIDFVPLQYQLHEIQHQSLKSEIYAEYDLVIGSGRVCMESLITGVPTIAFGEKEYLGLILEKNLQSALSSNFGDINLQKNLQTLSLRRFEADIALAIQMKNRLEIAADLKNEISERKSLSEKTMAEFSLTSISEKIERLYQSAIFIRHFPHWIPILMYHKIPLNAIQTQHKIFVTQKDFEKHLQFFKKNHFQTLTFNELEKYRTGQLSWENFPQKPLILTFDDGYEDNLTLAAPLLQKYNFKAQVFLLADSKLKSNVWDTLSNVSTSHNEPLSALVSGPDRLKWLSSPFEIGSHGFQHQKISTMSFEEMNKELRDSKIALENEFKRPISVYAFTYGDTTPEAQQAAEAAGYSYAVNTDTGALLLEENPYGIFRVNIFPNETQFSLWKKTSRWYRRYYFWKRQK